MIENKDPWGGMRGNLLLQSLSGHDAMKLAPALQRVRLRCGDHVARAGVPIETVYFPETLVVSLFKVRPDGDVQIGVVGREGMIGWTGLLGQGSTTHDGRVQMVDGTALAISADRLTALCAASPTLTRSLLRFVQTFTEQMSCTIASNLCEPLERRMARLLLLFHDRIDGDQLPMTHQSLAALLNARRAGVTDCSHVLEGNNVLRCVRGLITIVDREALETIAGASYGTPERSYRGAIGKFGKSRAI